MQAPCHTNPNRRATGALGVVICPVLPHGIMAQLKVIFKYLVGHLSPSSHCSILIETFRAGEAGLENDLSIGPI